MRKRLLGTLMTLLTALALSPAMRAQTAPKTASSGTHDISGVWGQEVLTNSWSLTDPYGHMLEDGTPYKPEALDKLKKELPLKGPNATADRNKSTDPVVMYCDPPGFPRILLYSRPFKIVQTPYETVMAFEEGKWWREIFMDRPVPKDPDVTWFGTSVGKWVGNALVVTTVGLKHDTWLDQLGRPHSDDLKVTERYTRPDYDTLKLDVTFTDPQMYTKPWSGGKTFIYKPKYDLEEDICTVDKATKKPAKGLY